MVHERYSIPVQVHSLHETPSKNYSFDFHSIVSDISERNHRAFMYYKLASCSSLGRNVKSKKNVAVIW